VFKKQPFKKLKLEKFELFRQLKNNISNHMQASQHKRNQRTATKIEERNQSLTTLERQLRPRAQGRSLLAQKSHGGNCFLAIRTEYQRRKKSLGLSQDQELRADRSWRRRVTVETAS
jgi:hypothetical protein